MKRTTFSIDAAMLEELHMLAAERGMSIATLIRDALEATLATRRVRPRSLGIGESGHTDTAELSGTVRPEPRSWRRFWIQARSTHRST